MITGKEKDSFHVPRHIRKYMPVLLSLLLILSILAIYWPVHHYRFLSYDDQIYVTDNIRVRAGVTRDNILWAFTATDAGFWHPLTWLSLMLDSSLYKVNAGGYHGTNVILHIGAALFLFLALYRMTGAVLRSCFVAALFALHPLHVESVAWIAERKDVLSGFFGMLTLFVYARYAKKPEITSYIPVLLCFTAGLMSKPMLITLPALLILLDYWPLGRFDAGENRRKVYCQIIFEKIPLLFISLVVCLLTFITEQKFGAISNLETISLAARISNAFVSYVIYMGKMIVPTSLAAYYPHPGAWPIIITAGSVLLIGSITFIVVIRIRQNAYLAVGWFWYFLTLVPVIGFIQLGTMARADRYTYMPLTGLFIAVTWLFANVFEKKKILLASCGSAAVLVCGLCSSIQIQYWQNDLTLFQRAVDVTENNYKAYHGLGMAYYQMGDETRAVEYIRRSLALKTNDRAHNDLGFIYMGRNEFTKAEIEFREALKLKPDNARAYNNLGVALASQGKYKEAIPHFLEALRFDSCSGSTRENLQKTRELWEKASSSTETAK